ncbi:MAG TPA: D-alanyl-D-alanine carboxypeptidase/D-alanyl-D-alanine-endopeptidase [Gemmatimonadaceae bacterium]|jgi:D-alanyl-D-alanine carboxypeptidase/D-alanyl-D-alanine-endopeptidase (penicillin-binding protein 4)|nr:D-alanyl-D-alanine carboxypeptidase/D-alanyl-D-alanine-endopeptidase [Gemmatimonadaceae bacterium]
MQLRLPSGVRTRATCARTASALGASVLATSVLAACATPRPVPSRVAPEPPMGVPTPDTHAAAPRTLGRSPRMLFRSAVDSLADQSQFRNANWGILVVDPQTGDTLYSRNAGKLFMPASNMKIVTASVALAQLGADFHFSTTFTTTGAVCGGVLHGDLIVNGRGDPSFSDSMRGDAMAPMADIADSLAARGIHAISGHVVPGPDPFIGSKLGYGWSWDDLDASYSAGVDALFFNEGFAQVVIQGGPRIGSRVHATLIPAAKYPTLHLLARTGFPPDTGAAALARARFRRRSDVALETSLDTLTRAVIVSGLIAPYQTDTLEIVYPDQQSAFVSALRTAIAARGITLRGHTAVTACGGRKRVNAPDTLFVYQSPPLRDILHAMLKPSQNQIAELLLRTIALEKTSVGRADSGAAVVERQLAAWGVAPDGIVMRDGSGLSRYDYVTPETLVRILDAVRKDTASFAPFYDGLPVAGVDGTLEGRMRGTPAQGNVHAKTGSVANARSLSGYVTTADGHTLIFSVLCNNWTVPAREVTQVQDEIAEALAAFTMGGTG